MTLLDDINEEKKRLGKFHNFQIFIGKLLLKLKIIRSCYWSYPDKLVKYYFRKK